MNRIPAKVRHVSSVGPGHVRLLLLALLVGLGAGVGAIVFRYLVLGLTELLSGHEDYSAAGHVHHPLVPWLGPFFVLAAPVLAGLACGRVKR